MSSNHYSFKAGKAGRALKHAQYICGIGNYASREDVVEVIHANMPCGVDAMAFWSAADQHERANGRPYSEVEVALPRELTREQQLELANNYARELMKGSHPYSLSIHSKTAADGGENVHIHLMFSERKNDGIDRPLPQYFKRGNSRFPEKGGAAKERDWNRRDKVAELRAEWEKFANDFLAAHALRPRMDLRSNVRKGIGPAEPKVGPSKPRAAGKGETPRPDVWRDRRARRVAGLRRARVKEQSVSNQIYSHLRQRVALDLDTITFDGPLDKRQEYKQRLLAQWYQAEISKQLAQRLLFVDRQDDRLIILLRNAKGSRAGRVIDLGDRVAASNPTDVELAAMVELAKAKGWTSVEIRGSHDFQRRAREAVLSAGLAIREREHTYSGSPQARTILGHWEKFSPKVQGPLKTPLPSPPEELEDSETDRSDLGLDDDDNLQTRRCP